MLEWIRELAGEVDFDGREAGEVLPLIPGRLAIRQMLEWSGLPPLGRVILRTLYATGIRPEELSQLGFREGRLEAAGRPVAADPQTIEAVQVLDEQALASAQTALPEWLSAAARAVGLADRFQASQRNLSPQIFRHAYAVYCLEGGMDLLVLSRLLGHDDLRTTERYIPAAMGACRRSYLRFHPLMAGRGGGEQADITVDEALALIEAPKKPRDRLMLRLLYATALRASELLGLGEGDIDAAEGRLFVRSGKGSQDRYALIDGESLRQLLAFVHSQPKGTRIFRTTRAQLFILVKRAATSLGLLEKYEALGLSLSPHSFRHACASHCYQRGMDPDSVRRLLGHDDLRNTLLYIDCPLAIQQRQYHQTHPWAND